MKIFHSMASTRFKKKLIKRLNDDDGNWIETYSSICDLIVDYFTSLFESSYPSSVHIEEVLFGLHRKIKNSINDELIHPISKEEIKVSLGGMAPLKAPSPNGMAPIFSKNIGKLLGTIFLKKL